MTSKRRSRIGRRSSRPLVGGSKGRVVAATTGLFVIAGSVGAAIWALVGRKRDEPAEPDEAAQPDAVPVSEEQFET